MCNDYEEIKEAISNIKNTFLIRLNNATTEQKKEIEFLLRRL